MPTPAAPDPAPPPASPPPGGASRPPVAAPAFLPACASRLASALLRTSASCRASARLRTPASARLRTPALLRASAPLPATASRVALVRSARGQASVELVVLLPVIVLVLAIAYQALLAGQAIWEVRVASRAAARAHSLGADPAAAARSRLRSGLERGLRVTPSDAGDVRVSVRVPAVIPTVRLGRVAATSHFRPQTIG